MSFPVFMDDRVNGVVSEISLAEFNILEKDHVIWNMTSSGMFSMKEICSTISMHMNSPTDVV